MYLWGKISTDGRAEHGVDEKLEGLASPPGSALVGEVPNSSHHVLK